MPYSRVGQPPDPLTHIDKTARQLVELLAPHIEHIRAQRLDARMQGIQLIEDAGLKLANAPLQGSNARFVLALEFAMQKLPDLLHPRLVVRIGASMAAGRSTILAQGMDIHGHTTLDFLNNLIRAG